MKFDPTKKYTYGGYPFYLSLQNERFIYGHYVTPAHGHALAVMIRKDDEDTELVEIPEKKKRPRDLSDVIKLLASVPSPTLWKENNYGEWFASAKPINSSNINDDNRHLVKYSLNPFVENPVILGPEVEA